MSYARVDQKIAAEGQCRLCERPASLRKLSRHRLVPGRWDGRYEVNNVVPLCVPCHQEVERQDPVARRMLRPRLWQPEIQHVRRAMGSVWFEHMYPLRGTRSMSLAHVDALVTHLDMRREDRRRPTAHSWTIAHAVAHDNLKRRKAWDPDLWEPNRPSEKADARTRSAASKRATSNRGDDTG